MAATYVNGNKVDTWKLGNSQVSVAKLDGKVVYDYASNTETVINISADNYNVTAGWVSGLISAAFGGGSPPSGSVIHFVVKPGVTLVAASTTDSFLIDASWWSGLMKTCGVILENQGTILGRGGQGGDSNPGWETGGRSGGDAITASGMSITIINKGSIGGGGGGGGGSGWYYDGSGNYNSTGGGGAPFGQPGNNTGSNYHYYGTAATLTAPGIGGQDTRDPAGSGGNGGGWGGAGGNGTHKPAGSGVTGYNYGGAAGNAVRLRSGGSVTWSVTGTLYGNVG